MKKIKTFITTLILPMLFSLMFFVSCGYEEDNEVFQDVAAQIENATETDEENEKKQTPD
ncbi:MAG: hypothetical protein RJQ09_13050 [Cyclobacteriaceae bacterium]